MTNIVLLSVSLSTNWTGIVSVGQGGFVEAGTVYKITELGYMEGTNKVSLGNLFPGKAVAYAYKTNNIVTICPIP